MARERKDELSKHLFFHFPPLKFSYIYVLNNTMNK